MLWPILSAFTGSPWQFDWLIWYVLIMIVLLLFLLTCLFLLPSIILSRLVVDTWFRASSVVLQLSPFLYIFSFSLVRS